MKDFLKCVLGAVGATSLLALVFLWVCLSSTSRPVEKTATVSSQQQTNGVSTNDNHKTAVIVTGVLQREATANLMKQVLAPKRATVPAPRKGQ